MKISADYKKFLNLLVKSYRKPYRPISKVIMAEALGSKFNLSPEYCKQVVDKLYQ
jgi:hypothetical protein